MKYIQKDRRDTTSMHYANMTKERWTNLIEHPLVYPDKSLAPLAIWGFMTPKVEFNDYGQPRCIGNNVDYMYALQVDVDNGCTMKDFARDYHRYRYDLYTSSGYGYKPGDRFRVIFPLQERLYTRHLVAPVKKYLAEFFPMSDVSCFDMGHFQILPVILSKDSPYHFERHEGKLLSFVEENFGKMAEEYSEVAEARRSFADADRDTNSNHQGALDFVQRIFDDAKEGERNRTMYAKLMWLRDGVGCTATEVLALRPPAGSEDEYAKMVQRLF